MVEILSRVFDKTVIILLLEEGRETEIWRPEIKEKF
jgi:hypothetical protein